MHRKGLVQLDKPFIFLNWDGQGVLDPSIQDLRLF